MKIGFVGVGKLGLPVCVGMSAKGHDVIGYDINPKVNESSTAYELLESKETTPDGKSDLKTSELLRDCKCSFTSDLSKTVEHAEILFCAVQTPHRKEFEGDTQIPDARADFDYSFLIDAVRNINECAEKINKDIILVIISTVLPGTIRQCILPILGKKIKLCYNPYFIAMGTVLPDFYFPEFILLGNHDEVAKNKVVEFYASITDAHVYATTIENAEMIKVSYNTFITAKICLANTIMIMCDRLANTDCDEVMRALFLGKNRIISEKYLTGGMGDGGGCHPRDNIALSWLSDKVNLNFNFYNGLMKCREAQTEYLVNLIETYQMESKLPIILLGKSFKPETTFCTGSPAILLKNMLNERKIDILYHFDPYIDDDPDVLDLSQPAIYTLCTKHEIFRTYQFPPQSIVIDPFRLKLNVEKSTIYHSIGGSNVPK